MRPGDEFDDGPVWAGRDVLAAAAIVAILTPLLLRATSLVTVLPGWDLDPLVLPPLTVGLGPGGSMMVDALVLLGCGLAFAAAGAPRRLLGLALLGCVPILWHGWLAPTAPSLPDQRVGLAWGSAVLAAVALANLAGDRRWRAVILGVLMGSLVLLAGRAASQALIEHPETVREYASQRDQILAAQGWSPGSSMARAYERRLMQNDASAWFGLSNVLASVAAAGVLAAGATLVGGWRRADGLQRAGLGLAAGAAGAALVLSQSKGGVGTLAIGVVAVGLLAWTRGRRWVGPLLVAVALAGIVARGVVGGRLAELSIWFRWFYVTAAARIGWQHPLLGVGPDGFKDAFLLVKNPLCPEEVASPHSILFDWWACLGIAGLAWAALLVGWVAGLGRSIEGEPRGEVPGRTSRGLVRIAVAIPVLATLAAAVLDREALAPNAALVRIGGLLGWALAAGAITASLNGGIGRTGRLGLAASGVALACHAQIELTLSWPQSAGLVLAWIAVAAAPERDALPARGWARWGGAVTMWALAAGVLPAIVGTLRWSGQLVDAAAAVEPFPHWQAIARGEVSPAEGRRLAERDASWEAAVRALDAARTGDRSPQQAAWAAQQAALDRAIDGLTAAAERTPGLLSVTRELSRLNMVAAQLAAARQRAGETGEAGERDARLIAAAEWARRGNYAAAGAGWEGTVHEAAAQLTGDVTPLRAALEAHLRAGTLDPTNPLHPHRAARTAAALVQAGDRTQERLLAACARRALELNAFTRLDPGVRGLSEADVAELRRWAELGSAGG